MRRSGMWVWATSVMMLWASGARAQNSSQTSAAPPPPSTSGSAQGRWDEVSDRVLFLTGALATVEASLHAIDVQIRQTGYKATVKSDAAQRAVKGNELMNRNMGMPTSIDWKEFYGKTAQSFFYHPKDAHTYYLNQRPIADRPPQLDYIYKANEQAKRQAEKDIGALAGKTDALIKRRGELERKQVALWTQIPFESLAYQELTEKPVYRFALKTAGKSPLDQQRLDAASAAAAFVRDLDHLMARTITVVNSNPASAFKELESDTAAAARRLGDALLKQDQLSSEMSTTDRPLQQLSAAAKRASALARNVGDAQQLVQESAAAGEDQAKAQYRGVLQNSLLDYATMLIVADSTVERMTQDWHVQPNTDKPIKPAAQADDFDDAGASAAPSPTRSDSSSKSYPDDAVAINGRHVKVFMEALDWNDADQRCKEMGGYLAVPRSDAGAKWLQHLKGKGSVVWLGAYRGKTGWLDSRDGHPIRAKLKTKLQPGDQAVVLSADGSLDGRPFSGEPRKGKGKDVEGFICAWDE